MRFRTWPVAALALCGLLLLVVFSLLTASRRAQEIYTQLDQLNTHHRQVDAKLRQLRSHVHLSGIFVRDYLLEPEQSAENRQRLAEFRVTNRTTLAELVALTQGGGDETNSNRMATLQAQLDEYWKAFDPLFDSTTAGELARSTGFLRTQLIPRREAVLAIAQEIELLNNASLDEERAEIALRQGEFRSDLLKLLWQSLLLGVVVAATAVVRLRVLERRSEEERAVAEEAKEQMRQLSQQLVATQEEERKKLSRELHDHVGQMLTALRMELGRIDRLRVSTNTRLAEAVVESRNLVDNMVRVVRDLAAGLRPSMLDDLGLQPALEWQIRDFTRRYGLHVEFTVRGDIGRLPDPHRTCVYRAVQEALTNCARHSGAGRIDVTVIGHPDGLHVAVTDDGIGLDPERRRSGLGLRGLEERVKELGGSTEITVGRAGRGTTLSVHLPVPEEKEVPLARAAG